MDYQTKTASSFDVQFEVAGPLVPVSQPIEVDVEVELNRLAAQSLEPYHYQVAEALEEFDSTYPSIAEVVQEREAFLAKRSRAFAGLRGQAKVAAASLMAAAVVISGIGFVSRAVSDHQMEQERIELQAEQEAKALRDAGERWALDALGYFDGTDSSPSVLFDLLKASPEVKKQGLRHADWLVAIDAIDVEQYEELKKLF